MSTVSGILRSVLRKRCVAGRRRMRNSRNFGWMSGCSALLDKLPPEQRVLFALRYEEELTVPQLAEVMGIPEGTVKSRLHYLLQYLRKKLKVYETL